jgi:hypothetical protein
MGWQEMYELAKFVVEKKENGESPERLQIFLEYMINKNV